MKSSINKINKNLKKQTKTKKSKKLKASKNHASAILQAPLNNSVRIIGGKFRGRKLAVLSATGLRPTPDRVRETVFNWLMNDLIDARCLDVFAGTGALGFEALSRGAEKTIFLENNPEIIKSLKQTIQLFKLDKLENSAEIYSVNALNYLNSQVAQISQAKISFDIVFCDPPFHQDLLLKTLELLINNHWVKSGSLIYIEHEQGLDITEGLEKLKDRFEIIKQKQTEQVIYGLLKITK